MYNKNMFEIDLKNKLISLIAKRNSGKSYLLRYMVKIQKHEFDKIFIICPTNILNDFYKNITEKDNIFNEYNEMWMESLIKKMTDINSMSNEYIYFRWTWNSKEIKQNFRWVILLQSYYGKKLLFII